MLKLKNLLIISVVIFFSILAFVSCQKEANKLQNESSVPTVNTRSVGIGIKIKGKPYRSTTKRPRDGKNCGCKVCFGLCDVTIESDIDFSKMFMVVNSNENTTRIYILEDLKNFESEFGIDNDILIPQKALYGTGIKSLSLLSGLYDFIEKKDNIKIDEKNETTYGYVDVFCKIE